MNNRSIDRTPARQNAGIVIPTIGDASPFHASRSEETLGLVEALGISNGFLVELRVREPNAGRLFGGGQLELIGEQINAQDVTILVVDCALSPIQQRNLERVLNVKIVDRTGLILEIFGVRARSAEGRLQVEMARQLYERSRLVRTWTHLERQRGGQGFLAGPGESQLEADRRMLDRRIARLKADLENVRRTRRLQRTGRKRRGKPIIALVGYTNAGKSTLFNRLTSASVLAADMPFATLDPTARDIELPSGQEVTFIDTVGFITDLPTHLIESFRATIEEAIEADLLLHVRDISHEDSERQADDVEEILSQLEAKTKIDRPPIIEVWNKSDLLSDSVLEVIKSNATKDNDVTVISSLNGDGIEALLTRIQSKAFASRRMFQLRLAPQHGKARAWLHENCEVDSEEYDDRGASLISVQLNEIELAKFVHNHPDIDPDDVILNSSRII